MNIITLIEDATTELSETVQFQHGEKDWQNLFADNDGVITFTSDIPVVYLDEPITSNDIIRANNVIDAQYVLRIIFGKKSELDWTPSQHDTNCVAPMRELAREFVLILKEQEDSMRRKVFKDVKGMKRTGFLNLFDANFSGCVLELTVEPLDDSAICVSDTEEVDWSMRITSIHQSCATPDPPDPLERITFQVFFEWQDLANGNDYDFHYSLDSTTWVHQISADVGSAAGSDLLSSTFNVNTSGGVIYWRVRLTSGLHSGEEFILAQNLISC